MTHAGRVRTGSRPRSLDRSHIRLADRAEGGIVIIEAPPGVGKTKLIEASIESAHGRDIQVLTARGVELEHELAFGGVRQLFGPMLARLDGSSAGVALAGPAAGAGPIFGISDLPVPAGAAAGPLEVVEDRVGPGSVDFWGISFSPSSTEHAPLSDTEFDRKITLLRACGTFFDGVAARVSEEMRKGPRGGGRDRTRIVRHTIRTESEDFAKQVGLRIPEEAALTPEGLRQHRETYIEAMRAYNAGNVEKRMRSWTLPFLIRHSAFHTLDHAWEMEDKDLSGEDGA